VTTQPIPLARASTLASSYYTDAAVLEREKELVFGATWQLVGRAEELERVGDFVPVTVLDEPIVITHGLDGQLHGFYNVCRHRAGQVALTRGNRKSLQCRYHGWTYGLDGSLRACPEMEDTEDFRKEDFGLMPIRVDRWGPFVFVCLSDSAPSLAEVMGAIPSEVAAAGYDVDRMRLVERREYLIECNWKVYVDNYLEGYHLPIAHPQLFKELDYRAYRVETASYHSKQHAPIRPHKEDSLYRRNLPEGSQPEALYYWVFPNLMLNLYPDNLQTNIIIPLGPERTLTRFEWYVLEPNSPGVAEEFARSFAFSDQVQQEDIGICEAVQKGLRSRTFDHGRYSVLRENGVHHFHGLLTKALGTGPRG